MAAAQFLGFDEGRRSDVGIAATEAANNVLSHAKTGELLICSFEHVNIEWLDLVFLDNGPGITDVSQAFEDGYSTAGTAGQGLGAIRRLSDVSSLYSQPRRGTVFWSRLGKSRSARYPSFGVVSVPMKGETECGDSFFALPGALRSLYMVVDGLGHGVGAAEAAKEAVSVVQASVGEGLTEILSRAHDALKKTRGAAMSLALVDHERQVVVCSGVGNVSTAVLTGTATRNVASQNGTVGAVLPRIQEYTYPIEPSSMLLMYSDGLTSKCALTGYSGLQNQHPQLKAGLLYRDFSRRRDDATVLCAPLGGLEP
jgi:anti-sigma regulatory factor (Ser/Thr protein kinase)